MNPENLSEFSDQKILQKRKNLKTTKIIDAIIIGITIGVSFYSVVENGFGFFTFFPLLIGYLIIKNSRNNKILEKEIQREITSRNLI